jgi:peptidoglycan/LPS O-acetylase OafA/YrhL
MHHTESTTRTIATGAFVSVALFPVIVVALNLLQRPDGYDAGLQAISELALGRAGWLMAIAFCGLAVGTLLLAVVIRRTCERAVVRPALLALASVLSVVSAVFRTDLGETTTVHGQIHNVAGVVTFAAMLVVTGISSYRFRVEPAWTSLALPTLALTVVGVVAFFLVPVLGDQHFGVAQRLLVGSFVCWMIAAAAHARRITDPARVSVGVQSRSTEVRA